MGKDIAGTTTSVTASGTHSRPGPAVSSTLLKIAEIARCTSTALSEAHAAQ